MWDKDLHKNKSAEDNMALVGKMKGKVKKDLSKLKCYTCGEYDHYASKCPRKKKGANEKRKAINGATTSSGELDDFSRRLKEEFSLVSHFSESTIDEGVVHG